METDATEEDKAAIEQMATQSADANGSGDVSGVIVKVEGMKAIDQIKKHVEEFKDKSIEVLRRCQDMVVQAKKVENSAPDCADKFAKMLLTDIVPHTKKLSKVCGMLEKLASGDEIDDAMIPALITQVDALGNSHKELMDWARKLDLIKSTSKRRKKPEA